MARAERLVAPEPPSQAHHGAIAAPQMPSVPHPAPGPYVLVAPVVRPTQEHLQLRAESALYVRMWRAECSRGAGLRERVCPGPADVLWLGDDPARLTAALRAVPNHLLRGSPLQVDCIVVALRLGRVRSLHVLYELGTASMAPALRRGALVVVNEFISRNLDGTDPNLWRLGDGPSACVPDRCRTFMHHWYVATLLVYLLRTFDQETLFLRPHHCRLLRLAADYLGYPLDRDHLALGRETPDAAHSHAEANGN